MIKNTFLLFTSLIMILISQAQPIPFDDEHWDIQGMHIIEMYKGQQSLQLKNAAATLKDESFENGIIEFDIFLQKRTSFSGIMFHGSDLMNYEEIYLRPHRSGYPDAFQYTPVFNGLSGWQLYHNQFTGARDGQMGWIPIDNKTGYNDVYHYGFDRWTHVKVVVSGGQAELFLDNSQEPTLYIPELKHGSRAGMLGLKSFRGATHFANFSVRPLENPALKSKPRSTKEESTGIIKEWMISDPIAEELMSSVTLDKVVVTNRSWTSLKAEKNGLVNIARIAKRGPEENTVLAKLEIRSDSEQIKKLDFGFSDRVRIYVDNSIVYQGNHQYRASDFRYLGTIGLHDSIFIPLSKGNNVIYFAVSESFGGWGLMAKLESLDGIQVK
ncbi:MAG: hypothetical protein KI790_00665 [Cyclobacteriaceae bacterium]|nr:hypothetical protein [Cyclobacteriaceae bacterium HetDA_MAG_MS6]